MFDKLFDRLKKSPDRADAPDGVASKLMRALTQDAQIACLPGYSMPAALCALDQNYSDLRLDSAAVQGKGLSPQATKEIGGNRPIWDFLRSSHLQDERAFAIVGAPGSGKTTLLRHVALTFAQGKHERCGMRPFVPVYFSLPAHKKSILGDKALHLHQLLEAIHADEARFPGLGLPAGFWNKQLDAGQVFVLIDGVDELGESIERAGAARWLKRQIEANPNARFLLAARPQAYREMHLDRPRILEVQPLRGERVRRFLESLYLAIEIEESQKDQKEKKDEAALKLAASKRAQELSTWLRDHLALSPLTATPLLLSAFGNLYRKYGAALQSASATHARTRVTVYAKMCEMLLLGTKSGATPAGLTPKHWLSVMATVAENMMRRKMREIKGAELAKVVAPLLPNLGMAEAQPEALVAIMKARGGLFGEHEPDRFRFAAHSLQEYLGVAQMAQKGEAGRRWENFVDDNFWYDALVMYCTLTDATGLLSACLASGSVPSRALMADCLEAAKQVAPDVQQSVEGVVKVALESEDENVQHQAAEARLFRRLRSLVRIDEHREIDLDFVTCGEYQFFIDEMKGRGHFYQPDHWTGLRFQKGQALQSVAGVRPEDARDFCVWLTMRQGGNVRYRLPRLDEARYFPAPGGALSTVCQDGEVYGMVGLNQKTEQAVMAQIGKLKLMKIPPTVLLERGLNRTLDHTFNRTLLRALDFNLDAVVERSLNRAIEHVRDMVLSRAFELGGVISPDYELARVLARAHPANKQIAAAVDRFSMPDVYRLLDEVLTDAVEGEPTHRFATLMKALMPAVEAENAEKVLAAQRHYLAVMVQLVYEFIEGDETITPQQRRQQQQPLAEFYAWLQIALARAAGTLLPWEGIRIVRDTGPQGAAQMLDLPAWAYGA